MVRPKQQKEDYFNVFFKKNVVAVGWSDYSFKDYSDIEKLFPKIDYLPKVAPTTAGKWKNQIRRFKHLKKGDRIVVPYYNSICLAEAEEEEYYSKEDFEYDQSNQRAVKYLNKNNKLIVIPRNSLSERLQRRLRVRGTTITNLWEFRNELELVFELAIGNKAVYEWYSTISEKENNAVNTFKKTLLKNIQLGKTNLQTGGIGLEKLISELLKIEGYSTQIPSKRVFPSFADADIIAQKTDRISEIDLLVQVKHHSGVTGVWGAEQLLKITEELPDEYSNCRLVMITSAKPSEDLQNKCENKDIVLIGGKELVDWIYDSLADLKTETKILLGISEIPKVMVE